MAAAAVVLRVAGVGFGLPAHFHPDENMLVEISTQIARGLDFNPHFFHWGGAHFYLSAGLLRTAAISGPLDHASDSYLLLRTLSAVLGGASVALLMLAAARLYRDRRIAILAGVVLAVTMLHVRTSHYATVDVAATFWMLAAIWIVSIEIDAGTVPRLSRAVAAGLLCGVAAGTKYHLALVLPAVGGALILAQRRHGSHRSIRIAAAILLGGLAGFFASNPFAIADSATFVTGIRDLLQHYDQPRLHPRNHGDNNWWFFLATLARGESDAVAMATAALGGLVLMKTERRPAVAMLWALPIALFAYLSSKHANHIRNLLPLVPFLALASAIGTVALIDRAGHAAARQWLTAAIAVWLATATYRVVRLDAVMLAADSRETAAAWLSQHLPPTARVALERELWANPALPAGVEGVVLNLADHTLASLTELGVDYVVMNSVSYRAYFKYPERMPDRASHYRRLMEDLRNHATEVAVFQGAQVDVPINDELPNPDIHVFRLAR